MKCCSINCFLPLHLQNSLLFIINFKILIVSHVMCGSVWMLFTGNIVLYLIVRDDSWMPVIPRYSCHNLSDYILCVWIYIPVDIMNNNWQHCICTSSIILINRTPWVGKQAIIVGNNDSFAPWGEQLVSILLRHGKQTYKCGIVCILRTSIVIMYIVCMHSAKTNKETNDSSAMYTEE